jgi:predicted NAD/FAD-dependent oxidoreductase
MGAVARHLARGLDVRNRVKVERLTFREAGWHLEIDDGEVVAVSDAVIVTVPPAQAVPLLAATPRLAEQVAGVVMRPCWAVLLGFEEPLAVGFDGAFVNVGPLAWVARNSSKPGRQGGEAWVLHATAVWSEQNLECDVAQVIARLRDEFAKRCVGTELPAVTLAEAHRWRYAQPDTPLDAPCLYEGDRRIGVAGDWCGGPRIEGAFLSGLALADLFRGRVGDEAGGGGAER